jgi:hypothetical protein
VDPKFYLDISNMFAWNSTDIRLIAAEHGKKSKIGSSYPLPPDHPAILPDWKTCNRSRHFRQVMEGSEPNSLTQYLNI